MLLFMWTVLVVVTVVKPANTELRIKKCCRYDEWIDSTQRECKKLPLDVSHINLSAQASPMAWFPGDLADIARGGGDGGGGGGSGGIPNCSRRHMLLLPSQSRGRYHLHLNGSLTLYSPTARGSNFTTTFSPEEFCGDRTEGTHVIITCPCNKIHCVNKCCPIGYLKRCSKFKCTCLKSGDDWRPFHDENELPTDAEDVAYEVLEANEPACPPGKSLWIDNPSFKPHHYTSYWWEYPHGYLFSDSDVCGDFVLFDNLPRYQTIGYCYASFLFEDMFKAGAYFRILPTVLLAVTITVLLLAPEKRLSVRGWVHSKSLLCHTGSLLLSNAAIASYVVYNDDVAYCRTIPFVMYFSLVAAAFWLNAICINMAWGFGERGRQVGHPGVLLRSRGLPAAGQRLAVPLHLGAGEEAAEKDVHPHPRHGHARPRAEPQAGAAVRAHRVADGRGGDGGGDGGVGAARRGLLLPPGGRAHRPAARRRHLRAVRVQAPRVAGGARARGRRVLVRVGGRRARVGELLARAAAAGRGGTCGAGAVGEASLGREGSGGDEA